MPGLKEFAAKLFAGGASNLVDSAKSLISQFKLSPEQEKQFLQDFEKETNRHMEALEANVLKQQELENADRDSARQMQIAALAQNDIFAKRFTYFLAAFVIVSALGYGIALLIVEIPGGNKRLVEQFADMYVLTGALMVLSFFYGAAHRSAETKHAK